MSSAFPSSRTQPSVFLSHGGGPCFFMDPSDSEMAEMCKGSEAANSFAPLRRELDSRYGKPDAIVLFSAHWEAGGGNDVDILAAERPSLLFDYYGFPEFTYKLEYPAPGHSVLAEQVKSMLTANGIGCRLVRDRGFDHGVFVPLMLLYPEADIPICQVSLNSGLRADFHVKLGQTLAPLLSRNIMIIGSGFATHNLRAMGVKAGWARDFVSWVRELNEDSSITPEARKQLLINWEKAAKNGSGRQAHPREEHWLPYVITAAAAGFPAGRKAFDKLVMGSAAMMHYVFERQPDGTAEQIADRMAGGQQASA